ncbi:autotransporter outer membrane beta-barrel domain-containing protein [uncultured Rhodospira sp.]|uniref:autotransporter outer membrane beta-barrel domain-containing protein n=1 Tax=uncultured Rhodospira sp. TaxID=1936189 RepID=UPI0026229F24|nr:autotransporter outer membrane beta-barrel domain-containing protein [uncultured Rhodospira sp.]
MNTKSVKQTLLGSASAMVVLCGLGAHAWAATDMITIMNSGTGVAGSANHIPYLEDILADVGETDNRHGAMQLNDTYYDGRVLDVNGGLFGSATAARAALEAQTDWSGLGDGYAAINHAVSAYSGDFRPGAYRIIHLLSFESDFNNNTTNFDRAVFDDSITASGLVSTLQSNDIKLVTWIDKRMEANGNRVAAIVRNSDSNTYTVARINASGTVVYETTTDVSDMFPEGKTDYTDIALESYGATLDRGAQLEAVAYEDGVTPIEKIFASVVENVSTQEVTAAETALQDSSTANNRISIRTVVGNISNRAGALARSARTDEPADEEEATSLRGRLTGLAGGDGEDWTVGKLGLWAEGSGAFFSDGKSTDEFWGHQFSFMAGADYRYNDNIMAGAGLGYENVNVDFKSDRERDVDYMTMTVYGAYLITDTLSVNALGSYGLGFNTTKEAAGLLADDDADHLSHRFITAANVAYNNLFDRVTTFGYAGISYSHESFEEYETSTGATVDPDDTDLAQIYAFGDVGYLFEISGEQSGTVEPYLSTRLEYDFVRDGNSDRFGAVLGGGVRAVVNDNLSLEVYGNTEVARSDESATAFGVNARYQF